MPMMTTWKWQTGRSSPVTVLVSLDHDHNGGVMVSLDHDHNCGGLLVRLGIDHNCGVLVSLDHDHNCGFFLWSSWVLYDEQSGQGGDELIW